MAITKPVIIAGAGPVGCTVALYLARHDIPVILLESEPTLPRTLRASTWHPPTMDMMDALGIAQPLIDQGLIVPKYQYRDRRTDEIAEFDLGILSDLTKHPYRVQVEQWRMTELVWDILEKEHAHAECRFSHEVTGVHTHGEGVEVLCWTGKEEVLLEGSFVIGCDGANSAVRKAAAILFEGFTWPERFLVASTPERLEDKFRNLAYVNYISDPDEWLVLLKTTRLWRVLIPTDPNNPDDDYFLSDEFIQERLHHMAPHDGDYEVGHRTLYRVHQRVARTYARGNITLAGDAAHINNPLGGMGMNGGIHDSWNLAEKLLEIHRGADAKPLLERYDRQRRGVCVKYVQADTIRNKKLMEARDPDEQRKRQEEFMTAASDPVKALAFVRRTSMFDSLDDAASIQ